MTKSWIKLTKEALEQSKFRHEYMGFVLPTKQEEFCFECEKPIKARIETLGILTEGGNMTWFCCDDHYLKNI